MKTGLEGRTVLITGAGRNIGRQMAVMFAQEGANLAICTSRNMTGLEETKAEAEKAGARVVCAAKTFRWGGYAGWFADPDGHLWEIVFNPRPFMD